MNQVANAFNFDGSAVCAPQFRRRRVGHKCHSRIFAITSFQMPLQFATFQTCPSLCQVRYSNIRRDMKRKSSNAAFMGGNDVDGLSGEDWEAWYTTNFDASEGGFEDGLHNGMYLRSENAHNSVWSKLPRNARYFDHARICVQGGAGGTGCVSFRREPYVAKGGPNGGSGGMGGCVYAEVDEELNTLHSFRNSVHFRAKPGANGQGANKNGRRGDDVVVKVPPGTLVRRVLSTGPPGSGPIIADIVSASQGRILLASGGRGGRGNAEFRSSLNKAPLIGEDGEVCEELWLDLELKVVADVGIVGLPNAGKSTLLGALSAARPKVATYAFTTLAPNLGVSELDFRRVVFADVPGLIEGASQGLGLGHAFLRHVERCQILVHLIDGSGLAPESAFETINNELALFRPDVKNKTQIVVINKLDLVDTYKSKWINMKRYFEIEHGLREEDGTLFCVSALNNTGMEAMLKQIHTVLDKVKVVDDDKGGTLEDREYAGSITAEVEFHSRNGEVFTKRRQKLSSLTATDELTRTDEFIVVIDGLARNNGRLFRVHGRALERTAQMTRWDYYQAMVRFRRILDAVGVTDELKIEHKIRDGDVLAIGSEGARTVELIWAEGRFEFLLGGGIDNSDFRPRPYASRQFLRSAQTIEKRIARHRSPQGSAGAHQLGRDSGPATRRSAAKRKAGRNRNR